MVKYDKVTQAFKKFFDTDTLQKQLDAKVDLIQFEKQVNARITSEEFK